MRLVVRDIERIVVNVPFTVRCQEWNAREVWQWGISEIVRVTTDSHEVVGYGETLPHYTWGRVSEEAITRVKGRNPGECLGDDSLGAGLQMALYDLVGKALGVPVSRLLNLPHVRDWCPISWWSIDMPPDAFAAEAQEALAQGYTSYKIKARPWWDVFEQVRAVSAVTPPHFHIDLDWNETLVNAGNAGPVLSELDKEERVAIFESPILQRDIEGYRLLRRKTTHPLALHFGSPPFPTAVRAEMCDGFVIGGGVASVLRQGALAASFDKPFWLQMVGTGLTTALSLHLGAALPMAQWPAVNCLNIYADDLLREPLTVQGGYARVPDQPGLGVEIDEEALMRYRMSPPYEIPRPRLLISVTWPSGLVRHYADIRQCRDEALVGSLPPQERGVSTVVRADDGTNEWADLYARCQEGPVHEVR